jgi:hypothetical protein
VHARLGPLAASLMALAAPLAALPRQEAPAREAVPLIRALRDTRVQPAPPEEATVAVLTGAAAIPHLVDILVAAKLPALDLSERVQTLSVPQRELILQALSRSSPGAVVAEIEGRLVEEATVPERIAALYALASAGSAPHVHRVIELALVPEETELARPLEAAFRCALERILRRHPRGFEGLSRELEKCRPELHVAAVTAIGATRDPAASETFTKMLALRRDLAGAILPQVRLVGRSRDLELNRALASAAADYLGTSKVELCCVAARTIGELNDSDNVEKLIDLLESESAPVRDSALWALRRISRLELNQDASLWRRWHSNEVAFWRNQAPSYFAQLERGTRATKIKAFNELAKRSLHRDEIAIAIAEVLLESDPRLREVACAALAGLGSPTAYSRLLDALEDDEETVRAASHKALQTIAGTSLPPESEPCRLQLRI